MRIESFLLLVGQGLLAIDACLLAVAERLLHVRDSLVLAQRPIPIGAVVLACVFNPFGDGLGSEALGQPDDRADYVLARTRRSGGRPRWSGAEV